MRIGDATLKQRVRDILNEHGGEVALTISQDRVLLDDYISAALRDAVGILSSTGKRINTEVVNVSQQDTLEIPTDFLSLVEVTSGKWKVAVRKITETGTPEYAMAMAEFTAPGVYSPVCIRDFANLIFLPSVGYYTVEYNKEYNAADGLEAEPQCATAVVYMAAALVMAMFENDNGKQRLSDIAMQYIK